MSGARVSTGAGSRQDYGTDPAFLDAVALCFGAISFDLAAHAANAKHARYFAPAEFVDKIEASEYHPRAVVESLIRRGVTLADAEAAIANTGRVGNKVVVRAKNSDANAFAFDAFKQDWTAALAGGLGWCNCEFGDVEPWAAKHLAEMNRGASTLLLTPAVCTDWNVNFVLGKADVYDLKGRLCFDGKAPFPKDCQLAHFWPGATGLRRVWDWKANRIVRAWRSIAVMDVMGTGALVAGRAEG